MRPVQAYILNRSRVNKKDLYGERSQVVSVRRRTGLMQSTPWYRNQIHIYNPLYCSSKIHTLQLYKRLAGFVMAYSFTDYGPNGDGETEASGKPAMVPMADILNHISDNNAHLEFGEDRLRMVTTQPIEKVNV